MRRASSLLQLLHLGTSSDLPSSLYYMCGTSSIGVTDGTGEAQELGSCFLFELFVVVVEFEPCVLSFLSFLCVVRRLFACLFVWLALHCKSAVSIVA
ncbi:uncharacterized protein K452DRAFT_168045 [Aplosporella prunicola CBS 121167]|uniref:Uncharacterized protein n=1 Tax=Aplosporella prunicola CBS 121167 TaxID=1176127 RepID=A0A6A6BKZ7_9PEZI|nr:uncharacterized protein K452DRAFT_168045 [Aplosporella prunicola CBS 121167]KAF2143251.1 hypothetical protein K452DRAFT_168045 [Aplosporella prunicola CBS 121167]